MAQTLRPSCEMGFISIAPALNSNNEYCPNFADNHFRLEKLDIDALLQYLTKALLRSPRALCQEFFSIQLFRDQFVDLIIKQTLQTELCQARSMPRFSSR